MTKNLLVNKFHFRHNGKRFGPGEVIPNVPASLAEQLVADHPGDVIIIEIPTVTVAPPEQAEDTKTTAGEGSSAPAELPGPEGLSELPGINPSATVAASKKK